MVECCRAAQSLFFLLLFPCFYLLPLADRSRLMDVAGLWMVSEESWCKSVMSGLCETTYSPLSLLEKSKWSSTFKYVLRLETLWSSISYLLVHDREMKLEIWHKQNKLCDLQSIMAYWAISKNLLILNSVCSSEHMVNIWQLIQLLTSCSELPSCSVSSRFLDLWFPEWQRHQSTDVVHFFNQVSPNSAELCIEGEIPTYTHSQSEALI